MPVPGGEDNLNIRIFFFAITLERIERTPKKKIIALKYKVYRELVVGCHSMSHNFFLCYPRDAENLFSLSMFVEIVERKTFSFFFADLILSLDTKMLNG